MAYSDKVIDHYENPRNVGSFDKGDQSIGTGMVGAPACGDVMKLQIKVGADGRKLEARLGESIDRHKDYAGAADLVRELKFLEKMEAEIDAAYEAIE